MSTLCVYMKKFLAAFIAVTLVLATAGEALQPPKAHAIDVEVIVDSIESKISAVKNTISAASDIILSANISSLTLKEYTLDPISFSIARLILNEMRKSIIRWINSGFQGSPAFVTDLQGFLLNVADKVIGEFIYGSELSFLCSPFELDVRIAIALSTQSFEDEVQCTLSDVIDNVTGFFEGDFLAGGLPGWFEITQNPNNNFYGAQASAKAALRGRLADGREVELNLLNWGNGFISKEGCVRIDSTSDDCFITLPGKTISDALTVQVEGDSQALLTADEINEVFSALFVQMTRQALTGAAGLLGLGRANSDYGGSSYLDAVGNPNYDSTVGSFTSATGDPIETAITDENKYKAIYTGIVERADDLLAAIEEYEKPTPSRDGDAKKCSIPDSIPNRAGAIKEEVEGNIADADENLATLADIQAQVAAAEANPDRIAGAEERLSILSEFTRLQAQGTLHSSLTIAQEEFDVKDLKDELKDLEDRVRELCERPDTQSAGDGGSAGD